VERVDTRLGRLAGARDQQRRQGFQQTGDGRVALEELRRAGRAVLDLQSPQPRLTRKNQRLRAVGLMFGAARLAAP
jgi:hypothetical protein